VGDLVGDGGEVALQVGDPLEHLVAVGLKQRAARRTATGRASAGQGYSGWLR
jgi:hypothetical protein